VRRIEALTGDAARHHLASESRKLHDLAGLLKVPVGEIDVRLAQLIDERKRLERELTDARKKLAMGGGASAGAAADDVRDVNGVKLLARAVAGIDMKDLKSLADEAKKKIGSGVVALVAVSDEGKAGIVVGVTEDLTKRFNAVELVKKAAETLGGKGGGGRPDMAQAGGPDGAKADAALAAVEAAVRAS
jgi:alanyl-tRNA synthetase